MSQPATCNSQLDADYFNIRSPFLRASTRISGGSNTDQTSCTICSRVAQTLQADTSSNTELLALTLVTCRHCRYHLPPHISERPAPADSTPMPPSPRESSDEEDELEEEDEKEDAEEALVTPSSRRQSTTHTQTEWILCGAPQLGC